MRMRSVVNCVLCLRLQHGSHWHVVCWQYLYCSQIYRQSLRHVSALEGFVISHFPQHMILPLAWVYYSKHILLPKAVNQAFTRGKLSSEIFGVIVF